jgi:translation initiation factor 2A
MYEFGAAHRNSICWAPHGSFLALAGFGNLAGEIDFYHVKDKKKCFKMGTNNAHCTIKYGWSPDSRYFMTATVAPRMNVDNGVKIFKYNGIGPVVDHRVEGPNLFDASWRPAPAGLYPDRPRTPTKASSSDTPAAATQSVSAAPPAKPSVYRFLIF